jgi:hypothetical protein
MKNTIEKLEGVEWPRPDYDSYVVTESHKIRKIPIEELTVEQLRLCFTQDIGVKHVIERTIELLKNNPILSGAYYDGDLLIAVLQSKYLKQSKNKDIINDIAAIAIKAKALIKDSDLINSVNNELKRL